MATCFQFCVINVCVIFLASLTFVNTDGIDICPVTSPIASYFQFVNNATQEISSTESLDAAKPTYIIVHGWNESYRSPLYLDMARDLSLETQGNIILVDYEEFGKESYVPCAWEIAAGVGDSFSKLIIDGINNQQIDAKKLHLIGHSLGAQISAYVAQKVQSEAKQTIGRISGLDPAGPLFSLVVVSLPQISLSENDADVVDVIHTSVVFGDPGKVGTVDFYLSGLLGLPTLNLACAHIPTSLPDVFCNHQLSKSLFRESIRSCAIRGERFFNWFAKPIVYGFHMPLDATATGSYYISINSQEPFGKGTKDCTQ